MAPWSWSKRRNVLRAALLIFALSITGIGAACLLTGATHAWPTVIWGAVLLVAILFERWRYHPPRTTDASWEETGEQFIDPESGKPMRVLYQPDTGERRYVESTGNSAGKP